MPTANLRQVVFPYGMQRTEDGAWVFFNRNYKHLGSISQDWADWNDAQYHLELKGLGPETLRKLDIEEKGTSDRIYFYDDGSIPEKSKENMEKYMVKLKLLLKLTK